jgi:hypothetical protein
VDFFLTSYKACDMRLLPLLLPLLLLQVLELRCASHHNQPEDRSTFLVVVQAHLGVAAAAAAGA